jgi:hypothetical protein
MSLSTLSNPNGYKGVEFGSLTVAYGFTRMPIELYFDMLLENHMDRVDLALAAMVRRMNRTYGEGS